MTIHSQSHGTPVLSTADDLSKHTDRITDAMSYTRAMGAFSGAWLYVGEWHVKARLLPDGGVRLSARFGAPGTYLPAVYTSRFPEDDTPTAHDLLVNEVMTFDTPQP